MVRISTRPASFIPPTDTHTHIHMYSLYLSCHCVSVCHCFLSILESVREHMFHRYVINVYADISFFISVCLCVCMCVCISYFDYNIWIQSALNALSPHSLLPSLFCIYIYVCVCVLERDSPHLFDPLPVCYAVTSAFLMYVYKFLFYCWPI